MNITLVMVSSLNGRITKGKNNILQDWASTEDQKHFYGLLTKARLIIMGSRTFEVSRKDRVLKPGTLRVVLTRNPKRYATETVPGRLEFSSESPKQLIKRLTKEGHRAALLIGGGEVNASFFNAGLVNKLVITIEPALFGTGKPLIADGKFNALLKLVNVKKLNKPGTLLCRYIVSKRTK